MLLQLDASHLCAGPGLPAAVPTAGARLLPRAVRPVCHRSGNVWHADACRAVLAAAAMVSRPESVGLAVPDATTRLLNSREFSYEL